MEDHRGSRKKLRRDRLELLRWRTAMRCGYGTVASLEDQTEPDERAKMYAVAWLDGWGEEWQRTAVEMRRLLLRLIAASGGKVDGEEWPASERDLEYFSRLNPELPAQDETDVWAAVEASMKQTMAGL